MNQFNKIAYFLLPLSVLFTSLSLTPNRIIIGLLLIQISYRNKLFITYLIEKKWSFLFCIIYGLFIAFGNKYLSKEAVLFLSFPLYFVIYKHSRLESSYLTKSFILSIFTFVIIVFFAKISHILIIGIDTFFQQEYWWNTILYKNLVAFFNGHPGYTSMFIITALILLLNQKLKEGLGFSKNVYLLILFSFLLILILLAVKIALIVLLLILISYSIFRYNHKRKIRTLINVLLPVIVGTMIFTLPGIKHRFTSDLNKNLNNSMTITSGRTLERIALWKASVHVIKQQPFTGSSFQGVSSRDLIYAKAKSFYPLMAIPKNCHNNFLEFGVRYGIVIMTLFILVLTYFTFLAIQKSSFEMIGFSLVLLFFSLTESFLFREQGITLVGIIIAIFGMKYHGKNI